MKKWAPFIQKSLLIGAAALVAFIALIGVEIWLAQRGAHLDFHNPSRQMVTLGQGEPLTYVVIGDSTAASEGASSYKTGIAETTARYLAQNHAVTYVNLAVSGARARDVLDEQVSGAVKYKPDVVLLAIGANDVTHATSAGSVKKSTQAVINKLLAANCQVKIVLTGSPDMGAVRRLPQPLRWMAGIRTNQLNTMFAGLVSAHKLTFAPIAAKTGPRLRANPSFFAIDKFHPNDQGYALWMPVLKSALDEALANQPNHCAAG